MWSAGVIIFILLAGYAPFDDDNDVALYQKIRRGEHDMRDPVWDTISPLARDLVVHPHSSHILLHVAIPLKSLGLRVLRPQKNRIALLQPGRVFACSLMLRLAD